MLALHIGLGRQGISKQRIVETLRVVGRSDDDARRAFVPRRFISAECGGDVPAMRFDSPAQDIAVLDRHNCALREKRQRRMAGVAEQRDAADRP